MPRNAHSQVALTAICVPVPVLYSVEGYNLSIYPFHSNALHPRQRQTHSASDLESIHFYLRRVVEPLRLNDLFSKVFV